MPKGSIELTNARKEEIVEVTSFTRTSIYNYFQTKEEIFLEILKKEYVLWIAKLQQIMDKNNTLSKQKFAKQTFIYQFFHLYMESIPTQK